jgi:AraC family transcriptional regulator
MDSPRRPRGSIAPKPTDDPRPGESAAGDVFPSQYRGDFVAWNGGAIFIGQGGGTVDLHAHYAIQCVIGWPDGLKVRSGRRGDWQRVPGALVASRAVHAIDVTDCQWSTVLFLEPETHEGRAIGRQLSHGMRILDADVVALHAARLERAWRVDADEEAVRAAARDLFRSFAEPSSMGRADDRVLAAIDRIVERGAEMPTLEELAAAAHLSPSRFRHLFVETTGMPLRSYLLWRRLLLAWSRLTQGVSIADAAHEAGFADAPHLARTCRLMFGLPPSSMSMRGPISLAKQATRRQDA